MMPIHTLSGAETHYIMENVYKKVGCKEYEVYRCRGKKYRPRGSK